jgi:hypothetical protein
MKSIIRSLMMLGLISVLLMGIAWAGGSETKWMAPAGEREELQGTEFPFPVGWVPGVEVDDSYVGREALDTGALPETVKPVDELKGTEFPFPVGWVPEEKEPGANPDPHPPRESGQGSPEPVRTAEVRVIAKVAQQPSELDGAARTSSRRRKERDASSVSRVLKHQAA